MVSKSLAVRTALILAVLTAAAFVVAAWLINRQVAAAQTESARGQLVALATSQMKETQRQMENSLAMVRGLAETINAEMASPRPDRALITDVVRRYTENDKASLGYWAEFEPNGFDGRDEEFIDKPLLAIPSIGRFSAYWVRGEDGSVTQEAGGDVEDIGAEDYYAAARDAGGELMFEPYLYEALGVETLMTSLMVPIKNAEGEFVGVAGVDVGLAGLQAMLAEQRPYGTGVYRLLSPTGMLMAGPETDQFGKPFETPNLEEILAAAKAGQISEYRNNDPAVGGEALRVYVPFRVGRDSTEHFILGVSAPESEVLRAVGEVRNAIALIGFLSVLVLAAAVFGLLSKMVRDPLQKIVAGVQAVAAGRLDYPIEGSGDDEVGNVARALRHMQRDLGQRIESERVIAAENLRVRNALDASPTATMIAGDDGAVVYINAAAEGLIGAVGEAMAIGQPNYQRNALGAATRQYRVKVRGVEKSLAELETGEIGQIEAAGRYIDIGASSISDDQGRSVGKVINWNDRTEEVLTEREVNGVVAAASRGDLSQRVDLLGKQGFFAQLGEALNQLLDATSAGVGEVQKVLAAVADRDLTVRSTAPLEGVFAEMRDDANLTAERLTGMLAEIASSAEQIRIASSEIAAGNSDLSSRTEAQAANLEETAASMEELSSTVKQNADSARQARQLAGTAADSAVQGNAAVRDVVATMEGIAASSRQIESIIGTIDGIAFQTNILALNAAVEAARAGEQGRGFAVVASEVRALAQRSAAAAREIKQLISASVKRVGEGTAQVHSAGDTMSNVTQSIRRVNDLMAEIAAASEEQALGIGQVSTTVTQMDGATQQNAALVEETTAAAHSMEDQVGQLVTLVNQFVLPGSNRRAIGE